MPGYMRTKHRFLLLMSVWGIALVGCASADSLSRGGFERIPFSITKDLYEAFRSDKKNDQLKVYDPSTPWPETFLRASKSFEECAYYATPFQDLDSRLLLKALQLCERRHSDEFQE